MLVDRSRGFAFVGGPVASAAVALLLLGGACTVDFGGTTGSGSGGSSTGSMGTTSDTTTGTEATTTGMGGAPGTTSASSGDSSSANGSSSSGLSGADLPFCTGKMTADDFESYGGDDTVFAAMGELAGPWEEFEQATHLDKVVLVDDGGGSAIKTRMDGGTPGMLYRKAGFNVTAPCAITAELRALTDGVAALRITQDPADLGANAATIEFDHDTDELRPFGQSGSVVQLPVTIALVVTTPAPHHVKAFYFHAPTQQWISLLPAGPGQQMDWIGSGTTRAGFGQVDANGDESRWDNFNVMSVPACALAGNCP